jgi:hypothetical protein
VSPLIGQGTNAELGPLWALFAMAAVVVPVLITRTVNRPGLLLKKTIERFTAIHPLIDKSRNPGQRKTFFEFFSGLEQVFFENNISGLEL